MPGPTPLPPVPPVVHPPPIGAPPLPPVGLPPINAPPGAVPPPPLPPIGRGPAPVLPIEAMSKTSNDACLKRLRQLNIEVAPKIYPMPPAPGTAGVPISLQTNVFGVELHGTMKIWHYMVHIRSQLKANKDIVFTKKGRDDFVVVDRQEKCCDILYYAVKRRYNFFPENIQMVYDGQNILYATADLFPNITDPALKTKTIQIDGDDLRNPELRTLPAIFLEIYATRNAPVVLSSTEVARRTADSNISANNRAFEQILELAFNQHCIQDPRHFAFFENGKMYFMEPSGLGFERDDTMDVGDGKQLFPGLKKRIQFVEGPHGRGQNNPSLVIDSMKVAFHKEEPVYNKIGAILNKAPNQLADIERERVQMVMKGLDLYTRYTKRVRHLLFEGVHHLTADEARFELKNGESITVYEYFKKTYDIKLQYPKTNLLVCKDRGNKNLFPMELVTVSRNQRVKISQQTSRQSQITTRQGAVLPHQRQRLIMTGKRAINLSQDSNPLLRTLGVYVCEDPLLVTGRQLPNVAIECRGKMVKAESGKWRSPPGHYHRPAEWPEVWAMYAVGTDKTNFTDHDLELFCRMFIEMCTSKGLSLTKPGDLQCLKSDKAIDQLLFAAKSSCKFIFVITDDAIVHLHQKYKVLEREHQMIIQDMKISSAHSVVHKHKKHTLENTVNKTNLKLGGINYFVNDPKREMDTQLIIGIGFSTIPLGAKIQMQGKVAAPPLVVGFASNVSAPQEFTGDFLLNTTGQDTLAAVEDIVKQCVSQFQSCRKTLPSRVIIYRSGASEGAHGSIISFEIPLARVALTMYDKPINLLYIVVTKDHALRFFRENMIPSQSGSSSHGQQLRASEMNIFPGTCVDSMITHPACKQFFLNPHSTLQGTAKTALFTVLADDDQHDMDTIEQLTYSLCHNHQIVSMTTSLPTPLYVAMEYAKRGRNMWNEAWIDRAPSDGGTGSERERLQELTQEICYRNRPDLIFRRVNA